MSFKPEVFVDGGWNSNALRFATKEEAEEFAKDLFHRWTLTRDYRAAESEDPVNYKYADGKLLDPEVGR